MTYSASGPASGTDGQSFDESSGPHLRQPKVRNATSRIQRMAALCAWIAFLATVACGDAPEGETDLEPADLGKLEQPLFLYTDYGQEQNGTMQRCSLPYAGGICAVPMRKTIYYYVYPWDQFGGCYGQFWNDAIQSAFNGINAWNTSFQTGFRFQPVNESDPRLSLYVWCEAAWKDNEAQHMGSWSPVAWGHCQDHGSDEVCKVGASWLRLSGNNIIEASAATGASWAQLQIKIENTVRHELGHAMGLAHFPLGAQSGTLMAGSLNSYVLADPKWNSLRSPSSYEASLVYGYCPDGNTAACE